MTGHHRKHGIRLLGQSGDDGEQQPAVKKGRRIYDKADRQALIVVWQAADRICSKRLQAALPYLVESMERHGHLDLDPGVRQRLLAASAATLTGCSSPSSGANGLGQHWTATLEPLDSRATDENGNGMNTDGVARDDKPAATSARKPTFIQRERWKAIQKARRKGMSLRTIERELGIHRSTIRKYLDAEGPPTRQSKAAPTASASDTIAA